ncbi:hypothetical protein BK010_06235 [Tenericutes bacterium MO-XQ]|nr:hypothetical protein BK010_06235 [Tenericutes bacterium MO-XQ]
MHTYKEIKNYIDDELASIKHPVTKDIRNIAHKVYVSMDKDLSHVIDICDQLLKTEKWHYKTIAFDIIFKFKKQYNKQTFDIFETWLLSYIHDWWDCDDFCTHAFGYLLMIYPDLFPRILAWKDHHDFAVRRATAVILIYAIRKNNYKDFDILLISDLLMHDEHYLVLKGYGWMLKVLSQKEPLTVYNYLVKNSHQMPRVAYRYALEKLPKEQKYALMRL